MTEPTDSTTRPPRPDEARRAALLRHDRESTTRPPRTERDRLREALWSAAYNDDVEEWNRLWAEAEALSQTVATTHAPDAGPEGTTWECGATEAGGYVCSRPMGHKGMHRRRIRGDNWQAGYTAGLRAAASDVALAYRYDEAAAPDAGLREARLIEHAASLIEWAGNAAFILPHWTRDADAWLERARAALAAHRSSDPSPVYVDRDFSNPDGSPGRYGAAPAGPAVPDAMPPEGHIVGDRFVSDEHFDAAIPPAPAGPAVDQAIDWPKRWSDDDIAWVKRQIIAEYRRAAGSAVDVDGVVAEMVGAQAVLEDAQRRLMKATDTLAGAIRSAYPDPTGEPE